MAVVGIAYEKAGSPGPLRETDNGFSITRTFIVRTNSRADGPIIVDAAVGLPQRGNVYASLNESHPYLFCTNRTIKRLNDKSKNWIAECEYETPKPGEKQGQQQDDQRPEFELPVIRGANSSELRDVEKTIEDDPMVDPKPIVNGVGEPFTPHPKKPVYFPTLEITRNEPITTPIGQTQIAYVGTINSDTFWGLGEAQWFCADISWDVQSKVLTSGLLIPYFSVHYVFHAKDTWDLEVLNTGYNYKNASGVLVPFTTAPGTPREGNLTSTGENAGDTASWITFKIYKRMPFAGLNLPQSPLAAVS